MGDFRFISMQWDLRKSRPSVLASGWLLINEACGWLLINEACGWLLIYEASGWP